ncbi:polyprotein of retroviral origin, putative, partial [Ixodes scapularis]
AKPTVAAPRGVRSALEGTVKAERERMQANGNIKRVTEPTDWVHPIAVIKKNDGNVRMCLDPGKFNAAVIRQHDYIPVLEELFARLSGSTVLSVLDAKSTFWQLALDKQRSFLCTFVTPWGRSRFLRVPFGLSTAPEQFQQAIAQSLR